MAKRKSNRTGKTIEERLADLEMRKKHLELRKQIQDLREQYKSSTKKK